MARSRYARGAVEVLSWCSRGTLGRGMLVVRSRYASSAVEVCFRSRCAFSRGVLPVQCGSLTFQLSTGDTVPAYCGVRVHTV